MKPVIGIVGGIGSGKSTVAREFLRQGCGMVNADEINHKVLQRKEIVDVLVSWWGGEILDSTGHIDRHAVSKIAINEPKQLKRLTDLVHPIILDLQVKLIEKLKKDENIKAIVLDVPLLIEIEWQGKCDYLVYIEVSDAIRHDRLAKERGWSEEKIKNLENLQISLDIKAEMSDYIVHSNSCISNLASQIDVILPKMLERFKG